MIELPSLWPRRQKVQARIAPAPRVLPPVVQKRASDAALTDELLAKRRFLAWVQARILEPVSITWTQNHSTMVSFRREPQGLKVRLQEVFAHASELEAEALAAYLCGKRGHTQVLSRYVAAATAQAPFVPSRRRRAAHTTQGQTHDLAQLFATLNAQYFDGRIKSTITWGQAPTIRRRRRRSMQLGCYVQERDLIRIHPALDQGFVPEFVVVGVVFHEMIHAHLGVGADGPRRRVHPPAFVAFERQNPDYERCCAWERRHLGRLMGYVRPPS